MNHVGLFSGIGGFEEAFRRAGASCLAVCEIEPQAQSVLRRHFPSAEVISDVQTTTKESFADRPIDILTGGFPCQDLSVAGRRAGLAGKRSGLWFEFVRIIGEHQPRWVVIENVPGLLSSNGGADFAVILRGLVELGYGVAYRIFDSQFDGVAQRRRRVFIVASLGSGRCAEVLFEREGSQWDSPPRREAGQGVAGNTIAGAVSSKWAKGTGGPAGDECYNLTVAYNLTFCDANGRRADRPNGGLYVNETEQSNTLTNAGQNGAVIAMQINANDEVRSSDIAYTLNTNGNATGRNSPTIAGQFGVRRLTPTECERLQGFPDGWTAYGHDGKAMSDSARYRMLGNAVCVPTVEWIARRIVATEARDDLA